MQAGKEPLQDAEAAECVATIGRIQRIRGGKGFIATVMNNRSAFLPMHIYKSSVQRTSEVILEVLEGELNLAFCNSFKL